MFLDLTDCRNKLGVARNSQLVLNFGSSYDHTFQVDSYFSSPAKKVRQGMEKFIVKTSSPSPPQSSAASPLNSPAPGGGRDTSLMMTIQIDIYIYIYIDLFIYSSIYLFFYLFIYLIIFFIYFYLFIYFSFIIYLFIFIYLFIY